MAFEQSTLPDHELLTEACHALSGLFATFNHFITLPQGTASSSQADLVRSLISFTINVEVFAEKLGDRFGAKNGTVRLCATAARVCTGVLLAHWNDFFCCCC